VGKQELLAGDKAAFGIACANVASEQVLLLDR
jgi:hypothetical protein